MAIAGSICPDIAGKVTLRSVAAFATRQHDVVSRAQLLDLGLSYSAIDEWIARGLLHAVHRSVYAVGRQRLTREGRWMAAVLAAGPGAVLSHGSAAALWGIRRTSRIDTDVTAPRRCRRPGIDSHRVALPPDEVTVHDGIPVTTPARTLFDLAAVLSSRQLEHALNEAEIRRLTSPVPLDALIARHPRRKGTQALRRALELQRQRGETVIRSDFETAFLDFAETYGLPRPRMNEPLGPYFPDACWPDERVIVELDSYAIHTTRQAFEQDRDRDRNLTLAGYTVVRVTWRQLTNEADALAEQLNAILAPTTPTRRSARRARPRSPATRSAAP
jgi:very-short-patch-repair endonuclease